MKFFELHGRKVRMGIINGVLSMQSRRCGRLGRHVPLFSVPEGKTLDECVAELASFKGDGFIYRGKFFGKDAEISFLEGKTVDFMVILGEVA